MFLGMWILLPMLLWLCGPLLLHGLRRPLLRRRPHLLDGLMLGSGLLRRPLLRRRPHLLDGLMLLGSRLLHQPLLRRRPHLLDGLMLLGSRLLRRPLLRRRPHLLDGLMLLGSRLLHRPLLRRRPHLLHGLMLLGSRLLRRPFLAHRPHLLGGLMLRSQLLGWPFRGRRMYLLYWLSPEIRSFLRPLGRLLDPPLLHLPGLLSRRLQVRPRLRHRLYGSCPRHRPYGWTRL
jgi:hypothetical protein